MKYLIVKFLKWYFADELWENIYSLDSRENNHHSDCMQKEKFLRMRIYILERELGLSNSFHRAENAPPGDYENLKLDYEYVRKLQ